MQETNSQARAYWKLGATFFDYLYLAFTGATAFSPTDTMPLSRRAKFLMMLEAILALIIISFLASRAINII